MADEIPIEKEFDNKSKETLNTLNSLIRLYGSSCVSCKKNSKCWNKVRMDCNCVLCVGCVKAISRIHANNASLQKDTMKQFAFCYCKKPMDQAMTKIVLKEDVDEIHKVLKWNALAKEKPNYQILKMICYKCGKVADIDLKKAVLNYSCC